MKFPTLLQIQTPIKHLKTGSKRVRIKEAAGRRPPHKTQQCVHPRQATIGGCAVVSLNNQVDISKKYGDMTMLPFEFHYLLSLNWRKFPNSLHAITLHYITLHYTTLRYTTLRYITLHYVTPWLISLSLLILKPDPIAVDRKPGEHMVVVEAD